MFSRGILETRPEVFHPDYFVVRMCCQGLKPGKLVNIRFVWNITRSQISSALLLSGARFEGLEAGRKKTNYGQFYPWKLFILWLVDADLPDLEDGGKNAKHLWKTIVNSMELLLELCFQMGGNGHQLSSGKTCQEDEEEDM